jgi:hypothetical protein
MRPVAMGSLVGHLVYGAILGAAYVRLIAGGVAREKPAVAGGQYPLR